MIFYKPGFFIEMAQEVSLRENASLNDGKERIPEDAA
jgi:hypothetical protein